MSKAEAARTWFGYGRWSAPYWFVGKEPGGTDDPENYASWSRLGGHELIDCREHDLDYRGKDGGKWHLCVNGNGPPLQSTWRPLILELLSFLGVDCDSDCIRDYQANSWGRLDGVTCVAELSGIAASSTQTIEPMRLLHRNERIATLKARISEELPTFVHFYGTAIDPVYGRAYADYWREIADAALIENDPLKIGKTMFVFTKHPTAHGVTSEFWKSLGLKLRG